MPGLQYLWLIDAREWAQRLWKLPTACGDFPVQGLTPESLCAALPLPPGKEAASISCVPTV